MEKNSKTLIQEAKQVVTDAKNKFKQNAIWIVMVIILIALASIGDRAIANYNYTHSAPAIREAAHAAAELSRAKQDAIQCQIDQLTIKLNAEQLNEKSQKLIYESVAPASIVKGFQMEK